MFHRDLDVGEVDVLEIADLGEGRLDEGLRHRTPVLGFQVPVERTAVHPDTDGNPVILCFAGDRLDVHLVADVAGVEPQSLHTGFQRRQSQLVLEMDVGDDRDRAAGHDLRKPLRRLDLVAGDSDDVGTVGGECVHLLEGAVDVGRLGGRHRLDADRGVSAHGDVSDPDLSGWSTGDHAGTTFDVRRGSRWD